MERIYIVTQICDFEYGCTRNKAAFKTREAAEEYINSIGNFRVDFWNDTSCDMYSIEVLELS
jgi:hypothetical protein